MADPLKGGGLGMRSLGSNFFTFILIIIGWCTPSGVGPLFGNPGSATINLIEHISKNGDIIQNELQCSIFVKQKITHTNINCLLGSYCFNKIAEQLHFIRWRQHRTPGMLLCHLNTLKEMQSQNDLIFIQCSCDKH